MVGDRWRDVEAGRRAGCRTVFIDLGYAERRPEPPADYVRPRTSPPPWTGSFLKPPAEDDLHDRALPTSKSRSSPTAPTAAACSSLYRNPLIKGFTTNPTLMRNAGITDYEAFARDILKAIPDRPISLEVFSDDFAEMEAQARRIASWGENVYVKIPVTNTQGESAIPLVRRLAKAGVKQNVTALMTLGQVRDVAAALGSGPSACVSVFAGRIADTGRDPIPMMAAAVELLRPYPAARADLGQPARATEHLARRLRSAATSSPSPPTS